MKQRFGGIVQGVVVLVLTLLAGAGTVRASDDEGLRKEALKLNEIVGDDPIEREVETLRKDPEHAKKLLKVAVPLAKDKDSTFNFNAAFILGVVAREVRDSESGKLFLRQCIDKAEKLMSDRKRILSYMQLIDLLFESRKFEETEKVCKEFMELQGGQELADYQALVLLQMIQALALQGKTDEALKKLDPFLKRAPDNPEVIRIHGWLLRHDGKYAEAAKRYEQLLEKLKEDERKDRVRYLLSGLYAESGDMDKATTLLKDLLKKKPDDATLNNDLGYLWADHDQNLDEAERMIRKALDKEPKNAAYLDSLGWVLFKQKKFADAKNSLQQAVKDPEGQHAEIYDHLGDVYQALNEKAEAVATWKKAVEASGTSKRDQQRKAEIEKKLQANQ